MKSLTRAAAVCTIVLSWALPGTAAAEDSVRIIEDPVTGIRMIDAEPGSEILVDPDTGDVVKVIPPEEVTWPRSVTVTRGCSNNSAACWSDGTALGDMQFAGTGTRSGIWPYRNKFYSGDSKASICFESRGTRLCPPALAARTTLTTYNGAAVTGLSVTRF